MPTSSIYANKSMHDLEDALRARDLPIVDRKSGERRFRGVICFAAVDWRFLKQRVHHLMTAFARDGLSVLFIENTGVRAPRLADAARVGQRLSNAIRYRKRDCRKKDILPDCLEVFAPLALPWPYHRLAVWYNRRLFRYRISSFLAQNSLTPKDVFFWTYLTTPAVLETSSLMAWGRLIYDVVSDPKEIEPKLAPYERRLLQQADLTLFASATLKEQYQQVTRHPVLFRDGFNIELAEIADSTPPEIAALPRPRFLYMGGINRKFWVEAITALSEAFPEASIILLGPVAPEEVTLPDAANIHQFPPCRCYQDLAGYLQAADIALIPYRLDRYAGAMHPAKLNEYLVFGLPVVATATPELSRLVAEWPEKTLYLANTPEEFAQVAARAIAEDSPEIREKRRLVTRNKDWHTRVNDLKRIL